MTAPSRLAIAKTESVDPTICTLKVSKTKKVAEKKIRKVVISSNGCMAITEYGSKVLLLVGETGSGKTLMLNSLLNYILGVKWGDSYRYKLDPDESEKRKDTQTQSQTEWISVYTLQSNKSYRIPYSVTIIDTPGFGDTAGTLRDEEITKQMKFLFNGETEEGITRVDAVIFVAQSDKVRLTESQKYVFDCILSLFGKDIKENIFLFTTFADQNVPAVLEGMKQAGIPYKAYYKFNNSPLYAQKESASASKEDSSDDDETETDTFNKMFWKCGAREFKQFFKELGITSSQSIKSSFEVLKEREALNTQLQIIPQLIQSKLVTFKRLSKEQEMLRYLEEDVNRNKDYKYTVTKEITIEETLPDGVYAMTCRKCKVNCHYPCSPCIKRLCAAFYWYSGCRMCPQKCSKSDHDNGKFIYVKKLISEEQTYANVKFRYIRAFAKSMTHKELVEVVSAKAKKEHDELLEQVNVVRHILHRLDEIALIKNPTSTSYYLEGLIRNEEERMELGWQDRVEELQVLVRATKIQEAFAKGFKYVKRTLLPALGFVN